MANQQRGETTIVLGEESYTLRPSFEAMCEIEDHLNCSMLELVTKFQQGDLRFKATAMIIWAGIHGSQEDGFKPKTPPTLEDVGNSIRKHGLATLLSEGVDTGTNSLVNFIIRGVMGDEEETKPSKPDESITPPMSKKEAKLARKAQGN